MKKYIPIILIILLSIGLVQATSVDTKAKINGTAEIDTTYTSGDSVIRQIVYVDGVAYLNITYEDGSSKLIQYIKENEGDWLKDEDGIEASQVARMFENVVNCVLMPDQESFEDCYDDLTDEEKRIFGALDAYQKNNPYTQDLLARNQQLQWTVEALENATATIDAQAYCQGRLAVMQEYNLGGVRCGDTYYRNHMYSPSGDPLIIGVTGSDGSKKPEDMAKLESEILIDSLDVPDKVYLDKPFNLKAIVKNQGDQTTEDYVTLAVPEGWETITPIYYTVNLEKGQSQILYFGIKPTTESGEVAVGSSVDFKSAQLRVQPLSITSRMVEPITNFIASLDTMLLGLIVACIAIPSFILLKRASITGIIHQAKPGTRFNYSYKMK